MTTDDRGVLQQQLLRDEGLRLKVYVDTVGKRTIGVGRNLDDVGITNSEALLLLDHDIDRAEQACVSVFPWFGDLDPVRQRVLINMTFNLGIGSLQTFTHTLEAVKDGRYKTAALAMVNSKWAQQVGARAVRLASMMESGVDA